MKGSRLGYSFGIRHGGETKVIYSTLLETGRCGLVGIIIRLALHPVSLGSDGVRPMFPSNNDDD